MSANRSTMIYGPAKFTLAYSGGSVSWFTEEGETVELKPVIDLKEQKVNGLVIDRYVTDEYFTLACPVDGRLTAARIAALWPYASSAPGAALFGNTDYALTITDVNGYVYTLKAVAVTKMPSLRLGMSGGKLIGEIELIGLRGNGLDFNAGTAITDGPLIRVTTGGTFADTGLTAAGLNLLRQPYTVTLGSALSAIDLVEDVEVDFEVELGTIGTQAAGTHQKFIKSVSVVTRIVPAFQAYDAILALMELGGATNTRGRSMGGDANNAELDVTGLTSGVIHYKQTNATPHVGSYRFGLADHALRDGQLALVSTRNLSSGVMGSLFTIAAS